MMMCTKFDNLHVCPYSRWYSTAKQLGTTTLINSWLCSAPWWHLEQPQPHPFMKCYSKFPSTAPSIVTLQLAQYTWGHKKLCKSVASICITCCIRILMCIHITTLSVNVPVIRQVIRNLVTIRPLLFDNWLWDVMSSFYKICSLSKKACCRPMSCLRRSTFRVSSLHRKRAKTWSREWLIRTSSSAKQRHRKVGDLSKKEDCIGII